MYLLTPPAEEPVTLAQAKLAARVDGTEWDALIPGLIKSARQVAEQETHRCLIAQTWRAELADWPASTDVLPVAPATAVAVSYWNGSAWTTLAGSAFAWAADGGGVVLAPALNTSWPTLADVAIGPRVRVDVTAGVANAALVDECAKLYITAHVAAWLRNPEAVTSQRLEAVPLLGGLLDPLRVYG